MHCVCLGATRQFVNLWMDSRHHEKNFYIGRSEKEIDGRLHLTEVPGKSAVHQGRLLIEITGKHQSGEPSFCIVL